MGMRRYTRSTNAFSKKVENHAHAISPHFMHYNFCRSHQTLTKSACGKQTTPAMPQGSPSTPGRSPSSRSFGLLGAVRSLAMVEVLDETERQARRHRLIIILIVAGLVLIALFSFVAIRNHSVSENVDSATADLRPQWQSIDLIALADGYRTSTVAANDTGDYDASIRLFPASPHASFATAQFSRPGVVRSAYAVDGWGGSSECLLITARGTAPPNQIEFSRGSSRC
jgi:hypothetical protein